MTNNKFPQLLQEKMETDIVNGNFAKGQIVHFVDLQNRYQANSEDLKWVIKSAVRKGLLHPDLTEEQFSVLGKSRATVISVFQHAAKSGLTPRSIVRAVIIISANELVAQKLHLKKGELVYQQTRTRVIDDQVVANQNNYIPIEVCPGLESVDLARTSFQTTLEGKFNAVVAKIEENFAIRPGNAEDVEILGVEQGADVLIVERLSLSPGGFPLVWADIHVRIDRYQYVKELWPEAGAIVDQNRGSK